MGFGRILGGALVGAGTGMAQVAEMAELERRQIALENLRTQNQQTENVQRADLDDRNSARDMKRRTDSALIIGAQEGEQAAAALKIKGEQTAAEKAADRAHEARMVALRGSEERLTVKARAAIENGQVQGTAVAENGEILIITKGGATIGTGQIATEKDRYASRGGSGEDGGVLAEVRSRRRPAPAAKPAPKPSAAPKQQGGTMTQADINETAKANGITPEMARRLLEQRGYKLKG